MKILIVEDDTSSRVYLERALVSQGYSVESAPNGIKALEKIEQAPPDLVISDIMMPEMDGFELCRRVKTDEQLRSIPFVFYTATFIDQKDEQLAMALGASRFLVKPMEPEDLLKTVKEVIEEYRKRNLSVPDRPLADMSALDRMQVEALARKLDKKVRELEEQREALRASEWKYRKLYESMMDGFVLVGMDGKILDCNEPYRAMLGYDIQELKRLTDRDITPEKWHAFEQKIMQEQVLARGFSDVYEKEYQKKDGTIFPIEHRVFLIRNEQGQQEGMWAIVRDLTERNKREEFLRKSQELNRNILESIGEGLIVIDRDYRILSANRAYCEQQHASAEDIVGKPCYRCSYHAERPCFEVGMECAPKQTFETGQPARGAHGHRGYAEKLIYEETKSFPLRDASGAVTSAVVIIEDITERRKLEEQLRQSQKMEAVGRLASGVAHDFNNILTAIMGYAYVLEMKMGKDDPFRIELDQILASSNRAASLTQSLLAFSRKQTINPRLIDLNETVRQVERFLHRLIGEDVLFDIKVATDAAWVKADHGQIEQVLMNLATNARDSMPKGGMLSIEISRVELTDECIAEQGDRKPGAYALLSVSDTGMGMDENTRKNIFEPFFTTKEEGKGTGLGLSIVYGIIKQHEGFINVYSELGKGTTFKIYLPLITPSTAMMQPQEIIAPVRGTETVLLAEDDEVARTLSTQVLEQFGYQVIAAKDGAEAVEKFIANKDRIKLLILDVIMPKKNAREVYDEVRTLAPNIKTLFMSGYTAEIIRKQKILDESLNFLSKPTSPTVFLQKVREVVDRD